ncbi:DMT family transporter [Meiothermus cerbereus]|jgi:transporter family-2 protein|uniref:DMT family transporter n=1 Tax=Meiothermus cerbereus TaxID=65552 RepID=UPI000489C991|nr:DMT family transporter [Meiothermus cerbereus]
MDSKELLAAAVAITTGILIASLGLINSLLQSKTGLWGLSTVVHTIGLGFSLVGLILFQQGHFLGLNSAHPVRYALLAMTLLSLGVGIFLVWLGLQQGLPWYSFLGGLVGLLVVMGTVYSVNQLGITNAITLLLVSQILAAAIFQHLGILVQEASPLSLVKLLSLSLMLLGAIAVVRS